MSSTKIELKRPICYEIPSELSIQHLDNLISEAKFPPDWLTTLAGYRVSLSEKLPPEEKIDPTTIYLVEDQKTESITVYEASKEIPPKLLKRKEIKPGEITQNIKKHVNTIEAKLQDQDPKSRAKSQAKAAKLSGEVASLCGFSSKEIGLAVPLAGFTELFPADKKNSEVERQLKFIYLLWHDQISQKTCSDDERETIRSAIQQDFAGCKQGRQSRISKIVQDYLKPKGLLGLFYSFRAKLVQKTAEELKIHDVHTHRYVFKLAAEAKTEAKTPKYHGNRAKI